MGKSHKYPNPLNAALAQPKPTQSPFSPQQVGISLAQLDESCTVCNKSAVQILASFWCNGKSTIDMEGPDYGRFTCQRLPILLLATPGLLFPWFPPPIPPGSVKTSCAKASSFCWNCPSDLPPTHERQLGIFGYIWDIWGMRQKLRDAMRSYLVLWFVGNFCSFI